MNKASTAASLGKTSPGQIILRNAFLEATLDFQRGHGIVRLDRRGAPGQDFHFSEESLYLRLAATLQQIDLPDWKFHLGSGEAVSPERELGFRAGFQRPEHDDSAWPSIQRINQFPIGPPGYQTVEYPGYCWFRHRFDLPAAWSGQVVTFGIGGNDCCDWIEYRVFLNGQIIGATNRSGDWHEAGQYRLPPSDPNYGCLRFGGSNVIAVQARGMDRREPEMPRLDLERFAATSLLVDQFVCVGEPWREVSRFELVAQRSSHEGKDSWAEFDLRNETESLRLQLRYWLPKDEAVIYKQVIVHNAGSEPITLLELDVARVSTRASVTRGGQGVPCWVGDDWFAGIRHPAGVARGEKGQARLQVLPGVTLRPGESYASKTAVFGTSESGAPRRSFVEHLQRHIRRKPAFLNLYSLYGLCEIASVIEPPTEITEQLILDNCDHLHRLRQRGVRFDYYCIDTGWNDPRGDWKEFYPKHFPNGPEKILRRIEELGMKTLLWMSPSGGPSVFRDREGVKPVLPTFCQTDAEARRLLREGMLHHIRHNRVRGFKLDGIEFFCAAPGHHHRPGKYAVETAMDAFIETLDLVRAECPDVLLMLYWGFASPWWLLHADTIFQRTLCMEGATPSDTPARKLRQSVTISLDQGHHYNWDAMPLIGQDSLGVWLSRTRWGSWMGKADWQDAWVMDFARGSAMSQLWGDLSLLDEQDAEFLSTMCRWTSAHGRLLIPPGRIKRILGSPWNREAYGYTASEGARAAVFIHNAQFRKQTVKLRLDDLLGLKRAPARWVATTLHPQTRCGFAAMKPLRWADEFKLELAPFEVRMLSIEPEGRREAIFTAAGSPASADMIEISCHLETVCSEPISWNDSARQREIEMAVGGRAFYVPDTRQFAKAPMLTDERDRNLVRRIVRGTARLPALPGGGALLVTAQTLRDGVAWHHHALFEIIRLRLELDGQPLPVLITPNRWHEQAGAWSWILFEAPLAARSGENSAGLEIESILPACVAVQTSILLERS